jgi:hypothetical protein
MSVRSIVFVAGTLLLLVAPSGSVAAQSSAPAAASDPRTAGTRMSREAMARFAWLEGEWEGPVTVNSGGRSFTLTQREHVQASAMNTALIIQGRGSMKPAGAAEERLLFAAAGVLTFDVIANGYVFFAASGTGQAQQFRVTTHGEDGFAWGYTEPGGRQTRYVISRTAKGEWYELGEQSDDGGRSWTKSLEMTLVKKR